MDSDEVLPVFENVERRLRQLFTDLGLDKDVLSIIELSDFAGLSKTERIPLHFLPLLKSLLTRKFILNVPPNDAKHFMTQYIQKKLIIQSLDALAYNYPTFRGKYLALIEKISRNSQLVEIEKDFFQQHQPQGEEDYDSDTNTIPQSFNTAYDDEAKPDE